MAITPRLFGERGRKRAASLGIDPERLPPGQSPTLKWPVLTVGEIPRVSTEQWLLSVDGAVEEPYVLDWEAFTELAQTDWSGDIHCVTRWSKFGMTWRGADARALVERARPKPEATHLLAHCYGGYTTNMPLSDITEHPALVAHLAEGAPLEPDHGGPARRRRPPSWPRARRWSPITAARPGCSCRTCICGSRPSGSSAWSCSTTTSWGS